MMKHSGAEPRLEQPHTFGAGELDEQVRVRIAVQRGVGRCSTQPDRGVVDVAFAGLLDVGWGRDVCAEGGGEVGERCLG